MATRESWRRQIAASNAAGTNQWRRMVAGRKRYNEKRAILKEIRLEYLRLEYLKLPLGLLPWGWISAMARECGTSPGYISDLLRELGIPGYWPKFNN